jgi:hypothetical protein
MKNLSFRDLLSNIVSLQALNGLIYDLCKP